MALKTYKPTTPSQRQLVTVDRSELYKGKPVKGLVEAKHSTGGRNSYGRVTVRWRGGGHKRAYRLIDFKRRKLDVTATVERLEYDPNRTAFIALLKYADGELSYILAPQRLAKGDTVVASAHADVKPGNAMPLLAMPVGTIVHNVERKPGSVRGVAMNPVDHPLGGGEGRTSGGRHPVSPWGQPTKGYKTRKNKRTNKFIARSRHARKG